MPEFIRKRKDETSGLEAVVWFHSSRHGYEVFYTGHRLPGIPEDLSQMGAMVRARMPAADSFSCKRGSHTDGFFFKISPKYGHMIIEANERGAEDLLIDIMAVAIRSS